MHASVSALYAGLLGLLLIGLAARVSLLRRRHHVGIGDGGNKELARAVRVHGNAAEWVPLALLLLLLAELNGFPAWSLHAAGSALFLGRILHAAGLAQRSGYSAGRFLGSALSWLMIVVVGTALVLKAVF